MSMHCGVCNSRRPDAICHKCGSETFVPCHGWTYPADPDIDLIRRIAREAGYAIGIHGTQERDYDIIAAPWTDDAIGNQAFINHLAAGLNARVLAVERKPLGRYSASIQIDGYVKLIDLSVAPIVTYS